MSYSIVTYCSKNYLDVLEVTLPSWIASDCDKIYIYTDHIPTKEYEKTSFIKLAKKESSDFGHNCAKKAESLLDLLQSGLTNQILLIDADCLIVKPLRGIFDNEDFDVSVTVSSTASGKKPFNNVSAGFIAVNRCSESVNFVEQWIKRQFAYESSPTRDQKALSITCDLFFKNSLGIIKLNREEEYNLYTVHNSVEEISIFLKRLETNVDLTKIVHLSTGIWKNAPLVDYIKRIFHAK